MNGKRHLTIISAALPEVGLRSSPNVRPRAGDSPSMEKVIKGASGMMAKKLRTKTASAGQPNVPAAIPIGTKTKSTLS